MILSIAACISQSKWACFSRPRALRDLEDFDSASRGPLGSVIFLLRIRGRAFCTTAIGAIITIIALGYEPSVQQILSYPTRNINNTEVQATIMQGGRWRSSELGRDESPQADALFRFQISILEGLTGLGAGASFDCPMQRCDFPDFDSLAVCGDCKDITHKTVRHCNNVPEVDTQDATQDPYLQCTYTPDVPPLKCQDTCADTPIR